MGALTERFYKRDDVMAKRHFAVPVALSKKTRILCEHWLMIILW
jgi:hypothetical protein